MCKYPSVWPHPQTRTHLPHTCACRWSCDLPRTYGEKSAQSAPVVAAIPVCLHGAEASVCGEKQPAPTPHACRPHPGPPPQPEEVGGRWGGLGTRRYECSHTCSGLSCCVSRQNVGPGGAVGGRAFMRVLGGVKGKRKRLPASRGSLVPVIFVFIIQFFWIISLFLSMSSNQTTAAELQDGAAALLALCTKKKKKRGVVSIPEPDF